jgi:GNAT superfamily N-acetyltransferase
LSAATHWGADHAALPPADARFEVEEGEPLAYCYELQLEGRAQRKGLGKHLMQLLELMVGGRLMVRRAV